jgi:uncharacterized protein (TIGR00299 family) protein
MKTAYVDCFSGISGDMFLGALLDAGLSFEELKQRLHTLPLDGYHLSIKREQRNQISGTRFYVRLEADKQAPRNLEAIRKIIQEGDLSNTVKDKGIEIFERLAVIEGKIHSLPPEDVHFHELGAEDSIIDIVGTLFGIECLEIKSIYVSHIPLGSGFAETSHGTIPIPAPATVELLKGIPVFDSGIRHEMVTPTGAALIKYLAASFGHMPPMVVQEVGYGIGKRDLPERPNLLRILIGEDAPHQQVETIVFLETNLDDTSPEWMGYLMERLFDAGALDVVFFPVQMKKNRPGVQVQVIGRADQREALMEILFRESTTLGVRFQYAQRQVLKRSAAEVESPWGKIRVKKIMNRDGSSFFQPEYDVCREIALRHNLPLRKIYHWIIGLNK